MVEGVMTVSTVLADKTVEFRRRTFPMVEMRVEGDEGEQPKIVGHAAVFNELSEPLWGFRERILPGAFKEAIELDDVRALWNHDPNYVLGRNKAGTLRLAEDDRGLAVEIDPPDTHWARDLLVSIRRGDVNQMSFAFTVLDEEFSKDNGENIRTLKKVRLHDVSVVTYPAYPQTDVQVRSILQASGIDWEALAGIMYRHQRGLSLTNTDRDMVLAAIEVLRSLVPDELSQGAGESDQEQRDEAPKVEQGRSLEVLRRRLELVTRI